MLRLSHELAEWARFRFRVPAEDKAIVFYSEHEGYTAYYEGLLNELERVSPVPVCYITSDAGDPILQAARPRLRAFHLSALLPFFMQFLRCRVFVMTLTDLQRFHLKRSIHPVHYAYVFHALNSTHMTYLEGAFDHYDSILCAGPHHAAEIRAREQALGLKPKTLVEAGYYRLERIHSAYMARTRDDSVRPLRVLIAPSWGEGNILESHGEAIAQSLLAAGFHVTMRPHPESWRRAPERIRAFEARFRGEPLLSLERSVATDDSILDADALITDWSGIALEYAFGTERPVLYLDAPRKARNPNYSRLGLEPLEAALRAEIGRVIPLDSASGAAQAVRELLGARERFRERIVALRRRWVYAFGRSSRIGAEHLLAMAGLRGVREEPAKEKRAERG